MNALYFQEKREKIGLTGYWLEEYKKVQATVGIPNTDIGFLRHSGVSFLIAPEPDGLNFDYSQIKSYMGQNIC